MKIWSTSLKNRQKIGTEKVGVEKRLPDGSRESL